MYTVLIQSKKTQESFLHFHPLLAASLEKKEIGECQWVPSGATLAAAVPELFELVRYKTAWRAVILRTEADLEREGPTRGNNPYDFLEEKDRAGLVEEDGRIVDRSAPLLRLTHLLGGVPAPERSYEQKIVFSYARGARPEDSGEGGVPLRPGEETGEGRMPIQRVEIVSDESRERQEQLEKERRLHERWSEANELPVTPPREILLVTVCSRSSSDEELARIRRAWYDRSLDEAEDFAHLNHYPHNCRFLIYPMNRSGAINRERDSFLMWAALAVLMHNPTNSDSLQARKLYRLSIHVDRDRLRETLQLASDRLEHAERNLRAELVREQKREESAHPGIPDYHVEVPISFTPETETDFAPDTERFGLTAALPEDLVCWSDYTGRSVAELARMLRGAERYLDMAADRLRRGSRYGEAEVYPLSPYQQEDLRESLDKDYENMLDRQTRLPSGTTDIRRRAEEADDAVRSGIQRRIDRGQALRAALIPAALLLLAFAAGFQPGAGRILAAAAGISALLCLAALYVVLRLRRGRLLRLTGVYQELMLSMSSELSRNAGAFTQFLSSVASHIRGCSFLDVMERKQNARDSSAYVWLKRLKAFELLQVKLRGWGAALGEELVNDEAKRLERDAGDYLDYGDDALFSLQDAEGSVVELNRSGVMLNTPFRFVNGLEIRREEIVADE